MNVNLPVTTSLCSWGNIKRCWRCVSRVKDIFNIRWCVGDVRCPGLMSLPPVLIGFWHCNMTARHCFVLGTILHCRETVMGSGDFPACIKPLAQSGIFSWHLQQYMPNHQRAGRRECAAHF